MRGSCGLWKDCLEYRGDEHAADDSTLDCWQGLLREEGARLQERQEEGRWLAPGALSGAGHRNRLTHPRLDKVPPHGTLHAQPLSGLGRHAR